jgi:hypothetical protein
MAQENTSTYTVNSDVPAKASTDTITADTYRQMLDILESLASHTHVFYDDYTTVCECQCQCDCSRGTL